MQRNISNPIPPHPSNCGSLRLCTLSHSCPIHIYAGRLHVTGTNPSTLLHRYTREARTGYHGERITSCRVVIRLFRRPTSTLCTPRHVHHGNTCAALLLIATTLSALFLVQGTVGWRLTTTSYHVPANVVNEREREGGRDWHDSCLWGGRHRYDLDFLSWGKESEEITVLVEDRRWICWLDLKTEFEDTWCVIGGFEGSFFAVWMGRTGGVMKFENLFWKSRTCFFGLPGCKLEEGNKGGN